MHRTLGGPKRERFIDPDGCACMSPSIEDTIYDTRHTSSEESPDPSIKVCQRITTVKAI